MSMTLTELSLEIIERILFALDPLDVARVSQVSRFFHDLIYGPPSQQFWRELYLAQPLDDPRSTVAPCGTPRNDVDWQHELQAIMRARAVIQHPAAATRDERLEALQVCLDLATHLPPVASALSPRPVSHNVRWLQRHLGDGAFLACDGWAPLPSEETQLLARLHTLYGPTPCDADAERRRASQAFVYSHRNHSAARSYGPYLPDGTGRVDWTFMWLLVHDFSMLLRESDDGGEEGEEDEATSGVSPLGIQFCQSVIPRGVDLDKVEDWAGVEGLWVVRYGFMDHREFILFNDPSVPPHEPQDTSIIDGTEEMLASLDIYFRVSGVEPDPLHPTRPKINVVGEVDGRFNLYGFVVLTEEEQLRWHFVAGNDDQMVWTCESIGLGGVRSQCGFIGVWSTVFHDMEDPIGPFWMQRELLIDEGEE